LLHVDLLHPKTACTTLMMGAAYGCVHGMVHKHAALRLAAADRTGVEGEDLGGAEALEADDSGRRAARPWCAAATPVRGFCEKNNNKNLA